MKRNILKMGTLSVIASIVLVGCGSSSDSSTGTTSTLSDPYIVGSTLYEDINNNGVYDADEPVSTATTQNGKFTFNQPLTAGKNIRIKTQGIHEGKTYDLNISAVVQADGSIEAVTPTSTFASKGLTSAQIATMLNTAASDANTSSLSSWSISQTDVLSDPLSGDLLDKKFSEISDSDLLKIQASLASYGVLKIMTGSETLTDLNSTALETSAQSGGEVNLIAREMLKGVVNAVNRNMLKSVVDSISSARDDSSGLLTTENFPEPSVEVITAVGVAIIDRLADEGYKACNDSDGNVTAGLNAVGTFLTNHNILSADSIIKLGSYVMGLKYKDIYSTIPNFGNIGGGMTNLERGFNAANSGVKGFRYDSNGTIIDLQ